MRASRPPRVCYVLPSLAVGGTERQLVNLVEGIVRELEVTIVCTQREGALAGDARRLGAYVRCLGCRGGWDPRIKSRLRGVFRKHRPDVVHTFLSGFDYAANAAAADMGIPVIVSSRRELATWMKRRHIVMQRRANALVDCIIANSDAVREFAIELERGDPELYHVIYNGIRTEPFTAARDPSVVRERFGIPHGVPVVGMVANFAPVKDHELFFAMASEIVRVRPHVHFLLVGGGRDGANDIRTMAEARGWDHGISFVSGLAEVPDLFSIMDVHVLTSKVEGFPNAVLEAMAAAKPVVAGAVGGIGEAVEDGLTGILIRSRDPGGFAEAVLALLARPEMAQSMGLAGRARVEARFSCESMVAAHRRLYDELLESRGH